jgi:hypothetical protein
LSDYRRVCGSLFAAAIGQYQAEAGSVRAHNSISVLQTQVSEANFLASRSDGPTDLAYYRRYPTTPIIRLKICAIEVALNHREHGVPGFDVGARPMAAAGNNAASATAARPPAAVPRATQSAGAALRAQRFAEAQRLLGTQNIRAALRDNGRNFMGQPGITPAMRSTAAAFRQDCGEEAAGVFTDVYVDRADAGAALRRVDLSIEISARSANLVQSGLAPRDNYVATMQRQLSQPPGDANRFQNCIARVGLAQVTHGGTQLAVASDAVASGWLTQIATEQTAFATERARLRGRRLHNAANDVTQCLQVIPTRVRREWGTSARFRLANRCGFPVEASWCANARECGAGHGNLWTIRANSDYPIFFADPDAPYIRVGGCRTRADRVPLPSDAAINRQGGIDTRHNDPPAAPGVGIMQGHVCE